MKQNETLENAIRLEKAFLALQEKFLPDYYKDSRIAFIDDCWKFIYGEFNPADECAFANDHLCGANQSLRYNLNAALDHICTLYKQIFEEIVGNVVGELAKATREDFDRVEAQTKSTSNDYEDMRGRTIEIPISSNPLTSIAEQVFGDWGEIADRMEKHDYAKADDIFVKTERNEELTDEDVKDYNKLMTPFVKKSLKDFGDIASTLDLRFVKS